MKSRNMIPHKRIGLPGLGKKIVASVLYFCLVCMPALSSAASLSGTSSTYLQSRDSTEDKNILGGYEYLDLAVQDLGHETLSFHAGGWLRYDFKGEEYGHKTANDIQYGYLSFKSKTDNSIVNLGRVMVSEGVAAAERVDGIYARTDLLFNFSVSAFGGAPVETEELTTGQVYGARLSHQLPGLYRIGVSFLKEEKNSNDFRKEEGLDLWVHPINKVDLVGRSNYNSITRGWMDNTYNLVLGPFEKLLFTTEASWINYKDYFTGSTSSAFSFDPAAIDPNEKVFKLGEEIWYGITDKISIGIDYTAFDYNIAGNAKAYGGALRYASGLQGGAGLSIRKMDGDTSRLQYMEYRLYGYKKINKLDLAVDLLDVNYDQSINGVSNAYSASIAGQYELLHNLKVGADVEYQKNPDYNEDIRAFVKVVYNFDVGGGTAHKASAEQPTSKTAEPAPGAQQPPSSAGGTEQGGVKEVKP